LTSADGRLPTADVQMKGVSMKGYFLLGLLVGANLALVLMLVFAPSARGGHPYRTPVWTGASQAIAQIGRGEFAAVAGTVAANEQVLYLLDAHTDRLLVYSLERNRVRLEHIRNLRIDFEKP